MYIRAHKDLFLHMITIIDTHCVRFSVNGHNVVYIFLLKASMSYAYFQGISSRHHLL